MHSEPAPICFQIPIYRSVSYIRVIARPVRTLVVAIRNTYLERTDSHGHKCPRNDNVVGRYTKFETLR